jgi:hypothetical protein
MTTKEGKLVLTAEDRTARAFDAVDRRIRGVSSAVSSLRNLVPAASVAGLVAAAKAAVQHADAIGDQAKQVGLTTTAYQELSFAAKQLDVNQQGLDAALIKFRDRLGEARMGSKEAAKDFRLLQLDPRAFRTTDEAFAAVTARLGQVKDEFSRSALQANLFGKAAGPQLSSFLTTSADTVAKLRREAHDLGAVLSEDTIAKADQAANKLEALANVTKTQLTEALVELAPVLTAAGEGFVTLAKLVAGGVRELQSFADKSSEALAFGIRVDDEMMRRNAARRRQTEAKAFTDSTRGQAMLSQFEKEHPELAGARVSGGRVRIGPEPPPPGPPEDPEEVRLRNEKLAEAAQRQADEQSRAVSEYEFGQIDARAKEAAAIEDLLNKYSDEGAALLALREDRAKLDAALASNSVSAERHAEAIKNIGKAQAELVEKQSMSVFADQAARNIQGLTANLISAAMAGENMADAIVNSLRRIAAEMAAQAALEAIFGAAAGSDYGWLQAIGQAGQAASARAMGGPVSANDPYIVGEEGPELFVPNSAGYVVPNNKLGAGKTVNVNFNPVTNIDARGATAEMLPQITRIVRESEARTKQQIFESLRRGTAPV